MADTPWRTFADLSLNLSTGELRRNDTPVPLERQPVLVLIRLVEDAGQLVTRDSLHRAVWPAGTHVDYDRGLNYCLRQLRIALGDDARMPRFIETVPRQGYRFIAPVTRGGTALATEPAAASAEPACSPHSAAPSRQRRTILAAGLVAMLAILTFAIERGPRNEWHHEATVTVLRTVHNWLF